MGQQDHRVQREIRGNKVHRVQKAHPDLAVEDLVLVLPQAIHLDFY